MSYSINGKPVGPIGYGLMSLHTPRSPPLTDDQRIAAVKTAFEAGCTYMNGGLFYGAPTDNSLTLMNKYFAKYPEDAKHIVLNIKGGYDSSKFVPTGSKEAIAKSIDTCLELLGPQGTIDQWEPARRDPEVDYYNDTLATINEYVKAGKIGGLSLSEVNVDTIREAAKRFKIDSVEIELSLFRTEPLTNGLLEACAELGITVLAYGPLGKGFLSGEIRKFEDIPEADMRRHMPRFQGENFDKNLVLVDKLTALAEKKGCTPGQVAVNWLLALSKKPGMPRIVPIPGTGNINRIKENSKVVELNDADVAEIDKILAGFTTAGTRYPASFLAHLDG